MTTHTPFHERLQDELAAPATLAIAHVAVDGLAAINHAKGHGTGDRVLVEVARRLRSHAGPGDLLARLGGARFGWILPGLSGAAAFEVVDAARAAIAAEPIEGAAAVTVCAGLAERFEPASAARMTHEARRALRRAIRSGPDLCVLDRAETVEHGPDAERAERGDRALRETAQRSLFRALDARHSALCSHAERVAELAVPLARALGWDQARARRLRAACIFHDLGHLATPDAILFKPYPLSEEEARIIQVHPGIGAWVADAALDEEQRAWIRGHHERWDGDGYPDGRAGEAIPEGARILAVAEAWDERLFVPTLGMQPASPAQVLADLRGQAGSRFWPPAIAALDRLIAAGQVRGATR